MLKQLVISSSLDACENVSFYYPYQQKSVSVIIATVTGKQNSFHFM